MIFQIVFLLLLLFRSANSVDVNAAYGMIKSALKYYNGHSVLLIFEEDHGSEDLFNFLTLQKLLSLGNDFYYSAVTTPSGLPKALEKYRLSLRETVAVWNPGDSFPQILKEVSDELNINSHKWLVATSNFTSEAFDNITIPLSSEFTIAKGNPRSGYALEEIYDVTRGMRLSTPLGRWSVNSQEFQLQASTYMFERRKDFQGAAIKLGAPDEAACSMDSLLQQKSDVWQCIHEQMWYDTEKMLNATTNVSVFPNMDIEDTIREEDVDLAFFNAIMNSYDITSRDYIWPNFVVQFLIVTSYITQKVQWETFILPFTGQMWMITLLWIILWDFILAFLQFLNSEKKNTFFHSYKELSLTTMFSFCSQGVLCPSNLPSTRIILLMMFIVPAVLFRGYSAVLTSFLTVQVDKQPFRNLEELSNDKEYKIGWNKNEQLLYYLNLESLSEGLRNKLVQARNDLLESSEEGVERMCNEKFSHLTSVESIITVFPECKSYAFEQRFYIFFKSIELKKGSWYKYYFDRCQRILEYSGIKRKMIRKLFIKLQPYIKYYGNKKNCVGRGGKKMTRPLSEFEEVEDNIFVEETEVPPIKMENIILPFVVLLLGVIASVIILFLEIVFFRLKAKRLHKFGP